MPYEYADRDVGRPALEEALARLAQAEPDVRHLAVDGVGDCLRRRAGDQADTEAVVAQLVALAVSEDDDRTREAALNACADAATVYVLPLTLFEPLVPVLSSLPVALIGYVLLILGLTHDRVARPIIGPYLEHPDASVRLEAIDALRELDAASPSE